MGQSYRAVSGGRGYVCVCVCVGIGEGWGGWRWVELQLLGIVYTS